MTSSSTSAQRPSNAAKRLLRDFKEIQSEPIGTVAASPQEDNMLIWHANLFPNSGPYKGIVFHLVITFPEEYPMKPPQIALKTYICHPNVFYWGNDLPYICLDLLKENYGTVPYLGWSSAYSVQSILLQLQGFLFDENIPQDGGYTAKAHVGPADISKAYAQAREFRCKCGHTFSTPYPVPDYEAYVLRANKNVKHASDKLEKNIAGTSSSSTSAASPNAPSSSNSASSRSSEGILPVAATKANCWWGISIPIPPNGLAKDRIANFFEVAVNKLEPRMSPDGKYSCTKGSADRLGLDKFSYAYQSDATKCHEGEFQIYGKAFGVGDVIGCGIETKSGFIRYWKNGVSLGQAFIVPKEDLQTVEWWPHVMLFNAAADVKVAGEFRYPITAADKPEALPSCVPVGSSQSAKKKKRAKGTSLKAISKMEEQKRMDLQQTQKEQIAKEAALWRKEREGHDYLSFLPDSIIEVILEHLLFQQLVSIQKVCKAMARVMHNAHIWERKELVCFFSKCTWQEDVLGVGISFTLYPNSSRRDTISSPLDLLSYNAFSQHTVRYGVWKEHFTHFLPVYINEEHGRRALPLVKSCLMGIAGRNTSPQEKFDPLVVLEVLPKLMNSMVVSLVEQASGAPKKVDHHEHYYDPEPEPVQVVGRAGVVPLHASERALQGYCAFHHLLLKLVRLFPTLHEVINERAAAFLKFESARNKKACPNLGEWLIYLAVADTQWKDVAIPYLVECLTRNVKWLLDPKSGEGKYHPQLANIEGNTKVDSDRLYATWNGSKTSYRLLMFQVHFLNAIARPPGKTIAQIAQEYDRSYGRPSHKMVKDLQLACKELMLVNHWPVFFDRIAVKRPAPLYFSNLLKNCVVDSFAKGYVGSWETMKKYPQVSRILYARRRREEERKGIYRYS